MIRVLVTVPQLERTASPYRHLMALVHHLPRGGFSLTVCSLRANGYEETAPVLEALGAKVFVARFRPRGRSLGHIASCLRDQRLIAKEGPFDVQHSFDFSPSPMEAMLARLGGRRFIFTQRNLNEGGHRGMLWLKGLLAERIVAITAAVDQLLQSVGVSRRKIVQINSGFEDFAGAADSPGGPPAHGRFVLSVGQLERRKRHEDGIEAFATLAARIPDLSLLIAGGVRDPAYEAELRKLIEDRALEGRVHLLGPRKDVMSLMRRAVCLLHCPESEAAGWVILEAMAVGLPVVASSVGGIKEIVENGKSGLLLRPGDIGAYASAVARIVEDPVLARGLAAGGLKAVRERYSATATVAQLARLYRQVCAD